MKSFFASGIVVLMVMELAGCGQPAEDSSIARVGESRLTEANLIRLTGSAANSDNTPGRRQIVIDDWIDQTLLAEEAMRLQIHLEEDVSFDLINGRNSILASQLLDRHFEALAFAPTRGERQAFFDANRNHFQLREPYYRVRFIETAASNDANQARTQLRRALNSTATDSLWAGIVSTYSLDEARDKSVAARYYPVHSLSRYLTDIGTRIDRMSAGQISPVIDDNDRYVVFQLVDEVEAGTLPELDWVYEEVGASMLVEDRKNEYRRLVQSLRQRATAEGKLGVTSE